MKKELRSLYAEYQNRFIDIRNLFPDDDLAGPFLMAPNSLYAKQQLPLLIVGQESGGWTYHVEDVDKQMEHYEKFNLGIDYWPSPFWNITRKVERALGNELYSSAWTNLSKFDVDGGRAHGEFASAISTLDGILVQEIEIVKPKICIFYTGPSFDFRLQKIFPGLQFWELPKWSLRTFCRIQHPLLPEMSFRSYHPKSLRINHLEETFVNFFKHLEKT
jgi:hypothetical protein